MALSILKPICLTFLPVNFAARRNLLKYKGRSFGFVFFCTMQLPEIDLTSFTFGLCCTLITL